MHRKTPEQEQEELDLALAISASLALQNAPATSAPSPSPSPSKSDSLLGSLFGGLGSHRQHCGSPGSPASSHSPRRPAAGAASSSNSPGAGGASTSGRRGDSAHCASPAPATKSPRKPSSTAAAASSSATSLSACRGCGQRFFDGYISALGANWHKECFKCQVCLEPINTAGRTEFAIRQDDAGVSQPYHVECHKAAFHPTCSVCACFIPAAPDGRVHYKLTAFFQDKYCCEHTVDGTPSCYSCNRLVKRPSPEALALHGTSSRGHGHGGVAALSDWGSVQLIDGRHLCLDCVGTMVVDTQDAQPLFSEVLDFYARLHLPHPERPPFMLVDAFTLQDYSNKEGRSVGGADSGPIFHVRGVTLATVYSSIPVMMRVNGLLGSVTSSQAVVARPSTTRCAVTGVLVVYGLPRLLTGAILAHELLHAYLRMRHVTGVAPFVEEGLAQLMAYIWLDEQHGRLAGDPHQQRFCSYLTYQIREDTSEIYGGGFRAAYEAFQARGLTAVIDNVVRTGSLL